MRKNRQTPNVCTLPHRTPYEALKQWISLKKIESHFGAQHIQKNAMRSVALFPKIGLAYNRIKKNANTSVMILLTELETGAVKERRAAKKNSIRLSSPPLMEISKLAKYQYFIIVRNPYSRLLSAFLDKFRREKFHERYNQFDLTPAGFHAFVGWLEQGGLHLNDHWDSQTKRMLLPLDKYDKVIRFENLQEDMMSFLSSRSIALRQDALKELYPSDLTKKTSASSLIHDYYTRELADRVYVLFQKDFEDFKYSAELPNLT